MKKVLFVLFTLSLVTGCNTNKDGGIEARNSDSTAAAKTNDEWVPVDSATAMKTMMEAGTPGKEHAMLAKSDGKWTAETTMWMEPGAPPITAKSKAINTMVLGGRYQQTSFKGDFMGMPYEGMSTTGYDNVKKVYFTTWMDNMSTSIMNMEGKWDEATKSINFAGKMLCPANNKECNLREVYRIVDENTHLMEMYGPDMKTGKEYKNMEIKFTKSM